MHVQWMHTAPAWGRRANRCAHGQHQGACPRSQKGRTGAQSGTQDGALVLQGRGMWERTGKYAFMEPRWHSTLTHIRQTRHSHHHATLHHAQRTQSTASPTQHPAKHTTHCSRGTPTAAAKHTHNARSTYTFTGVDTKAQRGHAPSSSSHRQQRATPEVDKTHVRNCCPGASSARTLPCVWSLPGRPGLERVSEGSVTRLPAQAWSATVP